MNRSVSNRKGLECQDSGPGTFQALIWSVSVQVEPSTKLFPAVFAQATSPNVFQFELGRIKVSMHTEPDGDEYAV